MEENRRIIIITGMHRSGTSALTKLLVDLGFDAGDNLMPPAEDNPLGYWEDLDIYNLNSEIFSNLSISWDSIENFEKRKIGFFNDDIFKLYSEKAEIIVEKKLEKSDQIVIKDPRFCVLIPFWQELLVKMKIDVSVLFIYRNPLSVANSMHKRNGFDIKKGLLLWYYYNICFLADNTFPYQIVSYHNLIANPQKEITKFHSFIGLTELSNLINQAAKSIRSELEHNKFGTKLNNSDELDSFPKIEGLWNYLNNTDLNSSKVLTYEELSSLKETNLEKYKSYDFTNLVTATLIINSSDASDGKKQEKFLLTNKSSVRFSFDQIDKAIKQFSLYFFDKPCKAIIENVIIKTAGEKNETQRFSNGGNYLLANGNCFYFLSNQPYFQFELKSEKYVHAVEFELHVQLLSSFDFQVLVSSFQIETGLLEKQLKSTEHINFRNKSISVIANELRHQHIRSDEWLIQQSEKNEQLKNEIVRNNEEITSLERKSRWLYLENNKLKNSLSWRLTYPLRIVQKLIFKAENLLLLLINDIGASFRLLKREGIFVFLNRFYWYLKGKRLKVEIEMVRQGVNFMPQKRIARHITFQTIKFKEFDAPQVSVIIPVYNNFEYTYQCCKSIVENTEDCRYEVIIIDDNSDETSKGNLKYITGAKIIRNENNIGFISSCNKAAKYARGKYICLLNNDTEVRKNWLRYLVEVPEKDSKVGIVGAKLLYPDGRLQEAGGIIWNDASGWNYGKFEDPSKPEYNYIKEVDYVSGACLLIRKNIWETFQGFDEYYKPAYYEDTDLAFKVRGAGYKVIYQPFSEVIHYEGVSNGINENTGTKKHQLSNKIKFLERWKSKIMLQSSPNGDNVFFHRDRSLTKKHLLVIDHYVPHFDKDAGSRSTYSYLKLFLKMGYQIHFIGDNFFKHEPYTTILQKLGVEVIYGRYHQKNIRQWFKENGNYFDLIITHRVHITPKYLDFIKRFTRAKVIYVGHDLQYLGSLRKHKVTGISKFKSEAARFKKIEQFIFNTVDIILPFSTYEAPFIAKMAPNKIVKPVPVYFFENMCTDVLPFEKRSDILFVGYFGHPPNPDAIKWFVQEVFDKIKEKIPDVRLNIVGSKPTEEVRKLANDDIRVTGYVSDQILADYYRKCKLAILPLRFGAGVKGKLLESMYYQLPTVVTPVAAEGVTDIEKYTMIAAASDEFAEKAVQVYNDKETWQKLSEGGRELIEKYFTENAARKILEEIL